MSTEVVIDKSSSDRALFSIAMMLLAVLSFTVIDACGKWLAADSAYPVGQILFLRTVLTLIPLLGVIAYKNRWTSLGTSHPWLTVLRGSSFFATAFLFFFSLRFLGLAEATVLLFLSPLFITALSVFILKEYVGWQRWAAIAVGFGGVYVAVLPDASNFNAASLLAIMAAFTFALGVILTRFMARKDVNASLFINMQLVFLGLSALTLPFGWETPNLRDLGVLVIMACAGASASICIIMAYRHSRAAIVAPFEYSALIWATMFGWFIWGEWPGNHVWWGAAILIACGLFIIYRETATQRQRKPKIV